MTPLDGTLVDCRFHPPTEIGRVSDLPFGGT